MTILTSEEIQPYRNLRISDEIIRLAPIRRTTLERLQLKEKELTEREYGLPFYLALQHHINGRTMKDLEKELGVGYASLVNIFGYYEIPRLDRSEARRRYFGEDGEFNNDRFSLISQERETIISAYDILAIRKDIEDWEELVEEVSEITSIELKVVTSCLEDLFGVKVGWIIKKFK